MKKYAYCNFCEHITEWEENEDGWRCTGCGATRTTEPEWIGGAKPGRDRGVDTVDRGRTCAH